MSRTKIAILAAATAQADADTGPTWFRAITAIVSLSAVAYLVWYAFSDRDALETRPACRCHRGGAR